MEEQCDGCSNWVGKVIQCPSCPSQVCQKCLTGTGCRSCTGVGGFARARVRVGWGSDHTSVRDSELADE